MRCVAFSFISSCLVSLAVGHGHLMKPETRSMKLGTPGYRMDSPVGHPDTLIATSTPTLDSSFVCRGHDEVGPITTTLKAGEKLTMAWSLQAAHVGDCSVWISYDTDLPAKDQRYFVIASIPKCKELNRQDVEVSLPSWLPATPNGKSAILRWGWYALHVHPTIEFYAQCVDVKIEGSNVYNENNLPTPNFKIPGLFPPAGKVNEFRAYRIGYNPFPSCQPEALADYPGVKCQDDGTTRPDFATYLEDGKTAAPTVKQVETPRPTPSPTEKQVGTSAPTVERLTTSAPTSFIPSTPNPTRAGECVAVWGKCNGFENDEEWTRPCCAGNTCNRQSKWYGQCVPGEETPVPQTPNPTRPPTNAQNTPAPTNAKKSLYEQYSEFCSELDSKKKCKKPCKWDKKEEVCNPRAQKKVKCSKLPKKSMICLALGCEMKNSGKCFGDKINWNPVETTSKPTAITTPKPTNTPKPTETPKPTKSDNNNTPAPTQEEISTERPTFGTSDNDDIQRVVDALKSSDSEGVFLYETPKLEWLPSDLYLWEDMIEGVKKMAEVGVGKYKLWIGSGEAKSDEKQKQYGLVNIAAFLAQAMQESIRYNACDENNWSDPNVVRDHGGSVYSATSACGQLHQSYQDYKCTAEEDEIAGGQMACEADPQMEMRAFTNAKWYGAPPPLFCAPKSKMPKAPRWNHMSTWCAPEGGWEYVEKFPAEMDAATFGRYLQYILDGGVCKEYEGQQGGSWTFTGDGCTEEKGCAGSKAPLFGVPDGRTDVEGCCWWGRGAIQSTGTCNYGKLSFYLGAKGKSANRDVLYPTLDFCKNPNLICDPDSPAELKWVAGFFYWLNSVQPYNQGGWEYTTKLMEWVDNGMKISDVGFIDGASGIVNRGCHNPPNCNTGELHAKQDRRDNFETVLKAMKLI